jgi:hypothetical protein
MNDSMHKAGKRKINQRLSVGDKQLWLLIKFFCRWLYALSIQAGVTASWQRVEGREQGTAIEGFT